MFNRQAEFTQWHEITTALFTWNCAGNMPATNFDISHLLMTNNVQKMPDIYAVGIQEMVKLNAKTVI